MQLEQVKAQPGPFEQGGKHNQGADTEGGDGGPGRTGQAPAEDKDVQRIQGDVEQAGDDHHVAGQAGIAVGPAYGVAEVHHGAGPGRQQPGCPVFANDRAQGLFGPEQVQDQALQQPDRQAKRQRKAGANCDHQAAQALGTQVVTLAQGAGDDGGGGDAQAHVHAADQLLHGHGKAEGRQRVPAQLADEEAVGELEGHQGEHAEQHGPGHVVELAAQGGVLQVFVHLESGALVLSVAGF